MSELIERLQAMRSELVESMAAELDADRDIHSWLPLLADIHAAVQAVETVAEEREKATG